MFHVEHFSPAPGCKLFHVEQFWDAVYTPLESRAFPAGQELSGIFIFSKDFSCFSDSLRRVRATLSGREAGVYAFRKVV